MPFLVIVDSRLCYPPFGGPHYHLLSLAFRLQQRGWKVEILSQRGPDPTIARLMVSHSVPVIDELWQPWALPQDKAERLAAWVGIKRPDYYLISNCHDAGWLALPLLPPTLPTLTVAHSDNQAYYSPVCHYHQFVDCAIGVSPQIRDRLSSFVSFESGFCRRCEFLPYGVETLSEEQFASKMIRSTDDMIRLVFVGRVVEDQKRIFRLIPILGELILRRLNFRFEVIGDGQDLEQLKRAVSQNHLKDRVTFSGWLDRDQLSDRLSESDVLILVSDSEGLPVAMLEAMGHGVLPIVSDIDSGMNAVIRDGENGYLVSPDDGTRYADHIAWLASNQHVLRAMQRRAWETSQEYTVDKMTSRYIDTMLRLGHSSYDRSYRPPSGFFPVMGSCRSRYPDWVRRARNLVLHGGIG